MDEKEQSIRERLKSGQMVGKEYTLIFRPVGSCQAVIAIEGMKFTVDDSTRPVHAGMVHCNKRKTRLPELKTQGDVTDYFASFPKLGKDDFAVYDRKHVPRQGRINKTYNCEI